VRSKQGVREPTQCELTAPAWSAPLRAGTEGRLSASLAELETRLLAECRVLDEKRDESLVTARSYADGASTSQRAT
jgi:hypothetical protein